MSMDKDNIKIHYLGHSTFILQADDGTRFIVDPWLDLNPQCPEELKSPENIHYILITHGHFDHMGDVAKVFYNNKDPKIVSNFEICAWIDKKDKAFEKSTMPMAQGGTQNLDGTKVTMVNAIHGSGIAADGSQNLVYGGIASGYIVQFSNGFTIYIAGDTGVFSDMKLIAEIYSPDLAILPIGDNFTMGPVEGFHACKMLNAKHIIPCHYGTFPVLVGDPNVFKELVEKELDSKVYILKPGDEL